MYLLEVVSYSPYYVLWMGSCRDYDGAGVGSQKGGGGGVTTRNPHNPRPAYYGPVVGATTVNSRQTDVIASSIAKQCACVHALTNATLFRQFFNTA